MQKGEKSPPVTSPFKTCNSFQHSLDLPSKFFRSTRLNEWKGSVRVAVIELKYDSVMVEIWSLIA